MSLLDQVLATAAPAGGDVQIVPLAAVHPDERNFYEMSDLDALAASIEAFGLEQPLVVRPEEDKDGEYRLISGHRRRAALLMLAERMPDDPRWAQVQVRVVESLGEAADRLRLIHGNRTTREKTEWERMMEAVELDDIAKKMKAQGAKVDGKLRDVVAQDMGISSSQVGKYLSIYRNLAAPLMSRYKAGLIGTQVAYACSTLTAEQQCRLEDDPAGVTLGAVETMRRRDTWQAIDDGFRSWLKVWAAENCDDNPWTKAGGQKVLAKLHESIQAGNVPTGMTLELKLNAIEAQRMGEVRFYNDYTTLNLLRQQYPERQPEQKAECVTCVCRFCTNKDCPAACCMTYYELARCPNAPSGGVCKTTECERHSAVIYRPKEEKRVEPATEKEESKPGGQTRADHIRSLGDEELVQFLCRYDLCPDINCGPEPSCTKCLRKWLGERYEEE